MTALRRLTSLARARLAGRPDSEHEQAIVRLVIGVLLGLYLLPETLDRLARSLPEPPHILVWIGFLVFSMAIFVAILAFPQASPARRIFGTVIDSATLSWFIAHFAELGIPLFLVYLWFTFCNGFPPASFCREHVSIIRMKS